jgi:peroxiredoxin
MCKSCRIAELAIFSMVLAAAWRGPAYGAAEDSADGSTAVSKQALQVGDPAPAWSQLEGVDGKKHSLKDLKEAKAIAVVFTTNHCPVAVAYEDRLVELHTKYKDQGVELVAINVNNIEADRLPKMKERAEEKGFEFSYLYDPSQKIGRAFGATVTPHAFLLDGDRKVVYMGAIDDNQNSEEVSKHYLQDAIEAVLAGRSPEPAKTKQFGCGIQYE